MAWNAHSTEGARFSDENTAVIVSQGNNEDYCEYRFERKNGEYHLREIWGGEIDKESAFSYLMETKGVDTLYGSDGEEIATRKVTINE